MTAMSSVLARPFSAARSHKKGAAANSKRQGTGDPVR